MKKLGFIAMVFLTGCLLTTPLAAEAPKAGHAVLDAYVTRRIVTAIDSAVGQAFVFEAVGLERAVGGTAAFDVVAFDCVGESHVVSKQTSTSVSCVKTDRDGDQIFFTAENSDWRYVDGTGKFKGITGKGVFKPIWLRKTGAATTAVILHFEGDWEIK